MDYGYKTRIIPNAGYDVKVSYTDAQGEWYIYQVPKNTVGGYKQFTSIDELSNLDEGDPGAALDWLLTNKYDEATALARKADDFICYYVVCGADGSSYDFVRVEFSPYGEVYSCSTFSGTEIDEIAASLTNEYNKSFYYSNKIDSASLKYSDYTYTGKQIDAASYLTVTDAAGRTLTNGTDYTLSYTNGVNVGYQTCTLTIEGKGSYTGSAIKPTVTVKDSKGNKLTTSDYTAAYSSNTNVGTATIKITGKGYYKGTLTKTFVIKPKAGTLTLTAGKASFKASWTKNTTASGYQITYSKDKNFASGVYNYTVSKNTTTSANFSSKPKSGETWYVKYRPYITVNGTKYYSNYSGVKSVKTK